MRKTEPSRTPAMFGVKLMRVMKRKQNVDGGPGQHNRDERKQHVEGLSFFTRDFMQPDKNGDQAQDRYHYCQNKACNSSFAFQHGLMANVRRVGADDHHQAKRDIEPQKNIPGE